MLSFIHHLLVPVHDFFGNSNVDTLLMWFIMANQLCPVQRQTQLTKIATETNWSSNIVFLECAKEIFSASLELKTYDVHFDLRSSMISPCLLAWNRIRQKLAVIDKIKSPAQKTFGWIWIWKAWSEKPF